MSEYVFVNGGVGFIGHYICLGLVQRGYKVLAIDTLKPACLTSKLAEIFVRERISKLKEEGVEIVPLDIDDSENYLNLMRKYQPSIIYNMNAVTNVKFCNANPHMAITENIAKVEKVLNYIKKINPSIRFVFASSSSAYGHFQKDKVDEQTALKPVNIYGYTKKAAEELISLYYEIYKIPYTIIRPSAPYGPRCINQPITQIIIEKALKNETITIKGDGSAKLDFTYVLDTAEGFILAGTKKEGENEVFNITYGKSHSLKDLLKIAKKYFPNLKVQYVKEDKISAKRGTLEIKKAKNLLNYQPKYSLEKGYAKYIEWYLKNNFLPYLE